MALRSVPNPVLAFCVEHRIGKVSHSPKETSIWRVLQRVLPTNSGWAVGSNNIPAWDMSFKNSNASTVGEQR